MCFELKIHNPSCFQQYGPTPSIEPSAEDYLFQSCETRGGNDKWIQAAEAFVLGPDRPVNTNFLLFPGCWKSVQDKRQSD